MILSSIYQTLFYKPLFNLLLWIATYLPGHNLGWAIIILTILIRIVLYPLFLKSLKTQKSMNELQPKLQELRKRLKKDPTQQSKELLALYQKHHVNPFTSIILMLVQFPILIALFQVFRNGLDPTVTGSLLYSFVSFPALQFNFLGILNLSQPSFILAILTAVAQFFQTKMSLAKTSPQKSKTDFSGFAQKSMLYFLPFITFMFLTNLNSAIGLYWITTTLFSIGQQYLINHPLSSRYSKVNLSKSS